MSIPGRQEQTLVYRVELDESSVANIIRTARESVGVGLQQATSMGNSVTSQGQLTTATAIAQVGSHLEFLERTRSALGAPASMADSAAGMGIARALGVQAGIVQPGFNELGSDMKRRASTALGGQYSTTGLSVASGVASAGLMAAGIGLAIAFPPSIPVMIGLGAVEMAADAGISTGFDRAISRTQMAGHLRRFGVGKSFAIAEQFERDAGMLQGSYGEMADVAKATLTSVRFQPGDNVNGALMGAIGDYRIAGKLLNMDKEQALGTVQEMYRAGMSPGQAAGYFGSVSGLSQRMGYDPAALHARALDFGRSATVGGYGAFDSMNQYMIQSSMVGQMVRSGAMNRGMLTAAAGFAGPEGEQVMGAAKNMMTQMLGFQQSGMGRGIMAGLMSGGTGDLNNLMSSAAGMSTQDILSFGGQKPGMALLASSQDALMNAAATAVKAAGGTVDVATMTSAIRSIGGMDFGVAQAMATGYMNPGNRGIAQYSGEIREIGARSETMGQPGAIGRLGGLAARGAGNFITNMWSGGSGPGMTADIERSGKWNNTVRNVIGDSEVHGLQGALQVAGQIFDESVGEHFKDWTQGFESIANIGLEYAGYNPSAIGRGDVIPTIMSRQDVNRLGRGGIRRLTSQIAGMRGVWRDAERSSMGFGSFLRSKQREIMNDAIDASWDRRQQLKNDRRVFNRKVGTDLVQDQYYGLVMASEKYKRLVNEAQLSGDPTARAGIVGEFEDYLQSSGLGIEEANAGRAATQMLLEQSFAFTPGESDALSGLQSMGALDSRIKTILGTKEKREQLAGTYFEKGSEAYNALISAENLDFKGFERIASAGVRGGNIRAQAAGLLRKHMAGGNSAATAIAMGTLESSTAELGGQQAAPQAAAGGSSDATQAMNAAAKAMTILAEKLQDATITPGGG